MQGCQDDTTYQYFAPLRLTEFQIPTDTDVNATNPPDRQCVECKPGTTPEEIKGGCFPIKEEDGAAVVAKSMVDQGRDECLAANKYLWCDQVPFPTAVSDGRCDPENNVLGCWDGGDCCQNTCVDGEYHCSLFVCSCWWLMLLLFIGLLVFSFVSVVTHFLLCLFLLLFMLWLPFFASLFSLLSLLSHLSLSLPSRHQISVSTFNASISTLRGRFIPWS